ncbi:MAG: hypothetical protein GW763_11325 [Paraglaciecola sp.]|nr:hypothetical protein [Paraglaciecola sp.]NCT48559.1 hypothetical protein [Paraglaciecola sp.]
MIRIMNSPLTNTIFAGQVNTKTNTWKPNKSNVTLDALVAVAQHVSNFGKPVKIMFKQIAKEATYWMPMPPKAGE